MTGNLTNTLQRDGNCTYQIKLGDYCVATGLMNAEVCDLFIHVRFTAIGPQKRI